MVNNAILKQKSYPAAFQFTDPDTQITLSGKWTSWQLAPDGAGQNVQLQCTVTSGTASGLGQTGDLTGTSLVIQVNLKKVAATDPVNDPTAKGGSSQALVVDAAGQGLDPAVSVISSSYPKVTSALLKDVLDTIFKNYFNANIGSFNHVFAVMNLNGVADTDGFQWLKPTAYQYAVASPEDRSMERIAFGLIAMVQGHPIEPFMQQAVDVRALVNLPAGANSAFVVSETMVAQNMLLRGAVATIQGSKATDFKFSPDGRSVVNANDILWGNFQTKNGVISPRIKKENFVLRADDTYVYVEISNAEYSPSAGVTVHMNLTQKFSYSTVKAQNGNYVFIPDISSFGKPSITANVSLSEGLQITEIILGAVAAIAGLLVIASGIGEALAAGAEVVTDEAANTGSMVLDSETITEIADENTPLIKEENISGGEDVDDSLEEPDNPAVVQKGGIFTSSQFRLCAGLTGAISGAISGSIGIAKAVADMDYNKIPAFDTFAANCMGASVWPGLADYKLIGASFRSSLVIALALDAAS